MVLALDVLDVGADEPDVDAVSLELVESLEELDDEELDDESDELVRLSVL